MFFFWNEMTIFQKQQSLFILTAILVRFDQALIILSILKKKKQWEVEIIAFSLLVLFVGKLSKD